MGIDELGDWLEHAARELSESHPHVDVTGDVTRSEGSVALNCRAQMSGLDRLGYLEVSDEGQCDYSVVNMLDETGNSDEQFIANEIGIELNAENIPSVFGTFAAALTGAKFQEIGAS
jgi:hypothetical protein